MPIDRKYTGYRDSDSKGYNGISAGIEYTKPESVCNQTNTWIGTDNVEKMIWVQIGWAYEMKPSKRVANYAEVHRHDGGYNIYYFTPITSGDTYEIKEDANNAVWNIGGSQVHSESWSGIVGTNVMPNAQYTVEVFEAACDYVPGSSTDKNYYTDIQTRATGGAFANATLATNQTDDPNGNAEKNTGSGDMWMAVWDTRAAGTMSGGGTHSAGVQSQAATPSLTWREVADAGAPDAAANALGRHSRTGAEALAAEPKTVEVSDSFAFGAAGVGPTHHLSLTNVEVALDQDEGQRSAKVEIDLFLHPVSQGIVSAATRSKAEWIAPSAQFSPADPEAELDRLGMSASYDSNAQPQMKVEDVLAAIWDGMGISPDDAGHIVMRPRIIAPTYPKTLVKGELVPERPQGLYWIVEVRGTLVHEIVAPGGEHIGHQTGMVVLVDDAKGDAFYGVGLP
ncbi:MAG: hypothetical protein QNJ09_18720 [Paracoccaceae bacterium]|nr:hypothetical protein [Paracoccaceae bacterium]